MTVRLNCMPLGGRGAPPHHFFELLLGWFGQITERPHSSSLLGYIVCLYPTHHHCVGKEGNSVCV
jgi:hypothetical protein